jgi:hypothetical protein
MEEVHLSVFAPSGLPAADYDAMHKALSRRSLRVRLRRTARRVLRRHPALRRVRLIVTR